MSGKKPSKPNGKNGSKQREAAYFLSLSLENVRCFGPKQTLDLSDGKGKPKQWTLLLGNNGTGKTTVLQGLVGFEELRRPLLDGSHHITARINEWADARSLFRQGSTPEASSDILAVAMASGSNLSVTDGNFILRTATFSLPSPGISVYRPPHPRDHETPRCFGYGAARRSGSGSLSDTDSDDPTATLFSDRAELRNAEEWLLQLDYSVSKNPKHQGQKHRQKIINELLIAILPEVDAIRFDAGTGTHPKPKVEFQTPYGWVPLRQLGYGYQTLIAWMVDFASRMVERYPDSPDPLKEPAVVLVDEIDLHLHPTWQRKLIGFLSERFPNTQFIATAHSPLIVQAAGDANIAVLRREGDHVVIDQSVKAVRGWRIDQVLTSDLFGLESARPPDLDDLLRERDQLLEKPKLTAADRQHLKELDIKIGPLPGGETSKEVQEMLELTRQTQNLLREVQAHQQ